MVITKGAGADGRSWRALRAWTGCRANSWRSIAIWPLAPSTHEEAKERRREKEQQETTFFGSLDGASKFVKGDAIAGLLITLLNMIMGLIIGIVIHDMELARAFETYAILTVGDGLVSQIPAVIISIASALLLARGGATGSTDMALFSQLGRYPPALATVGVLMGLFALVPGLPFLPLRGRGRGVVRCGLVGSSERRQTGRGGGADPCQGRARARGKHGRRAGSG